MKMRLPDCTADDIGEAGDETARYPGSFAVHARHGLGCWAFVEAAEIVLVAIEYVSLVLKSIVRW